ncbi:hypothetical protein DFS34DRAFT_652894 [Phlyctochytrium arcticum]|nr:hypothetical protein DFS34DRAFT_652894 [Phlyctochytrium arcticum]
MRSLSIALILSVSAALLASSSASGASVARRQQQESEQKMIKCIGDYCGCFSGYCWKKSAETNFDYAPSTFCTNDTDCLLGCSIKSGETITPFDQPIESGPAIGRCYIRDLSINPPEIEIGPDCTSDKQCFTYKRYMNDKRRRSMYGDLTIAQFVDV